MYPSSLSSRAISTFTLEVGMRALSWSALFALRIRVSMSAIGSVTTSTSLPAALRHSGDRAVVRELPQADPAEAELSKDRTWTSAAVTARVGACLELLRPSLLDHQRLLCHLGLLPLLAGEGQAKRAQKRERLVVLRGSGRDRDVESTDLRDVVVVDLGEDELLANSE